jgi:two-component sensor histidine kinase
VGIIRANLSGEILYSNRGLAGIFGFDSPADFKVRDITTHLKNPADLKLLVRRIQSEGRLLNQELTVLTKTGEDRNVLFSATLNEGVISATVIDVTERRTMENQIKNNLKEKETLLKEIHHRVKNNMQIVISLLNLQSAGIRDPNILDLFKESQNRIFSMSLVHEMLYGSENLSKIDFGRYVEKLIENIDDVYKTDRLKVDIELDAHEVELGIDDAVPCGLIVQEIVSNSFKHAFPAGWKGVPKIHVRLKRTGDRIELILGDNGIGMPAGLKFGSTRSLGLTLIHLLGKDQLGGEVSLKKGKKGSEFTIRFQAG